MSGLNVNTPDFVPGGAAAPVNPFDKLAAKAKTPEFVPFGGAPEFVPGVGYGGAYSASRPPASVPASHVQQRGNGKREGDDMSLSEVRHDCVCCLCALLSASGRLSCHSIAPLHSPQMWSTLIFAAGKR
jgi:hypothetical protein